MSNSARALRATNVIKAPTISSCKYTATKINQCLHSYALIAKYQPTCRQFLWFTCHSNLNIVVEQIADLCCRSRVLYIQQHHSVEKFKHKKNRRHEAFSEICSTFIFKTQLNYDDKMWYIMVHQFLQVTKITCMILTSHNLILILSSL